MLKFLARVRGMGIRFILGDGCVVLYSITPSLQTHNILLTPLKHNHKLYWLIIGSIGSYIFLPTQSTHLRAVLPNLVTLRIVGV